MLFNNLDSFLWIQYLLAIFQVLCMYIGYFANYKENTHECVWGVHVRMCVDTVMIMWIQ